MSSKKYLIGLTGNVATGKSAVLRMLKPLGARVIDADALVHQLMVKGTPIWQAVLDEFGEGILGPEGEIDRGKLGAIVFADAAALKKLEAIVHPAVTARVDELIRQATEPVVVVEAIKLIEAGWQRTCDAVWVVTCPREQQLERLMRRRELSLEEALLRIEAQSPQEDKVALADVVIDNSGSLEEMREQVEREWERLGVQRSSFAEGLGRPPSLSLKGGAMFKPYCFKDGDECRYEVREESDLIFVLMPFAEEFDDVYQSIKDVWQGLGRVTVRDQYAVLGLYETVKGVWQGLGLRCLRSDEIFQTREIMCVSICQNIQRAQFIVADVTGKDPNVFYELGIAHILGKPVVLITQRPEDVPFDLRAKPYVHYGNDDGTASLSKLKRDLSRTATGLLEREKPLLPLPIVASPSDLARFARLPKSIVWERDVKEMVLVRAG